MIVAKDGLHSAALPVDLENCDIKGTTAKVIDKQILHFIETSLHLIDSKGKRSCYGLGDEHFAVQAGDCAGVFRCSLL